MSTEEIQACVDEDRDELWWVRHWLRVHGIAHLSVAEVTAALRLLDALLPPMEKG